MDANGPLRAGPCADAHSAERPQSLIFERGTREAATSPSALRSARLALIIEYSSRLFEAFLGQPVLAAGSGFQPFLLDGVRDTGLQLDAAEVSLLGPDRQALQRQRPVRAATEVVDKHIEHDA